ncbi:hypothetical protein LGM65_00325 [Burkholderia anthina]|uniref:hypothetical protein n=1 Tax=Burkholderia anthina TaxID=179879 RepID=UPI001CF42727|nr:hypothetical protein [Burkholderia anthina]MCA8089341.1 hypothetical protein [Burkholderia anthina]
MFAQIGRRSTSANVCDSAMVFVVVSATVVWFPVSSRFQRVDRVLVCRKQHGRLRAQFGETADRGIHRHPRWIDTGHRAGRRRCGDELERVSGLTVAGSAAARLTRADGLPTVRDSVTRA